MEEKTKDLLCRILDMDEVEMRAALISVVMGDTVEEAVDAAYNYERRYLAKHGMKGGDK